MEPDVHVGVSWHYKCSLWFRHRILELSAKYCPYGQMRIVLRALQRRMCTPDITHMQHYCYCVYMYLSISHLVHIGWINPAKGTDSKLNLCLTRTGENIDGSPDPLEAGEGQLCEDSSGQRKTVLRAHSTLQLQTYRKK